MRVARVEVAGSARVAVVSSDGGSVALQDERVGVLDLLTGAPRQDVAEVPIADVRLLAPLRPTSIRDFSVFEQHIEGIHLRRGEPVPAAWYEMPVCFFSNPLDVSGPGADIAIPPGCHDLDLELEVAAIIGRPGQDLTPEEAEDRIVGYTIFNDWSARDRCREELRLGLGLCKGKDFASTFGPWIVTPDELADHRDGAWFDLELRAAVNGRELGRDTLANMAWSFPELVAYASRGVPVHPGDVIGSGTCGAGSLVELRGRYGAESYPPLQAGDEVTLTVEGIGTLTNRVVAGRPEPVPLPPARRRLLNDGTPADRRDESLR